MTGTDLSLFISCEIHFSILSLMLDARAAFLYNRLIGKNNVFLVCYRLCRSALIRLLRDAVEKNIKEIHDVLSC